VKEVAYKEAVVKRFTKEVAMEEAAVGAAGDSPAPGQAPPSAVGAKRATAPSGSTPLAKRSYKGVWKPRYVPFSHTLLFSPRSKVQF
jgi:hypothetical protein